MGAVPGFCGANHHSCIARKLLGTAPDEPGDSPEFTTVLFKLAPFGDVPMLLLTLIMKSTLGDNYQVVNDFIYKAMFGSNSS